LSYVHHECLAYRKRGNCIRILALRKVT